VGEENEEAGSFFVKDRAKGEVDLGETGSTALSQKGVAESHV